MRSGLGMYVWCCLLDLMRASFSCFGIFLRPKGPTGPEASAYWLAAITYKLKVQNCRPKAWAYKSATGSAGGRHGLALVQRSGEDRVWCGGSRG